jgi:hypothetical protein
MSYIDNFFGNPDEEIEENSYDFARGSICIILEMG